MARVRQWEAFAKACQVRRPLEILGYDKRCSGYCSVVYFLIFLLIGWCIVAPAVLFVIYESAYLAVLFL